MGRARYLAAHAMVAAAAALDTTTPEAVGKRGAPAEAGSAALTASTCRKTAHAGRSTSARTGEPPGNRPRAHV
eukprot:7457519-Alexandrium_andersonii.AAC.1